MRSFEAVGGCDGCHGYPPSANTSGGPNGYAAGYTPFKDESATPHAAHAAGSGNYTFSCSACHLNNSHDSGTFQDVFLGVDAPLATGDGNMSPTYNPAGSGTCANVYCHSNGGARTSDVARTYTAASIPVWTAGSTTGAITTCNACHDNSGAMANGSVAHAAHLALTGVTCKTCHVTTADSATVLAAGAIGGTHVSGTVNVAFDTSGFITVGATPYTAATGTCSVYCHSNGTTFASPDWDVATSGDCGACHQYSLAGVATGSGTALSATHNKHVYTTYNGVQLACTTCHTNAGSGADHVNGSASFVASYQTAVCNVCHGAQNGNNIASDPDRQPVWGDSASVDCSTCHLGIRGTIAGKTPLAKDSVLTAGHNRPAGNYAGVKSAAAGGGSNSAANKVCADCHNLTASAGHLNGVTDDNRLVGGFACNSCHAAYNSHQVANCADCHDPHGTSNWFMVRSTSPLYNGGGAATVVFTARSGAESFDENDGAQVNADDICATCHTSTNQGTPHNNKEGVGIHNGGNNQGTDCFSCHKPHTDPTPFAVGAGTSCNGCHGFPPATAAHAKHAASGSNDKDLEDRTDCEACHTGAASYTYSPTTDQGALLNHSDAAGRRTILASEIGFTKGAGNVWTCTNACHISTTTDGFWYTWDDVGQPTQTVATRTPIDSTGLNCTSCHYYSAEPTSAGNVVNGKSEALGGDHSPHFGLGGVVTCDNCHVVPTDSTHISIPTGTDAQKYQDRAFAEQDEADVTAAALNTGTDADPGNATCNNIDCHNPSNDGAYTATWTVANVAGCAFCHSATDPGTGSHDEHMGAATTFGINTVACTSCHVNNGTNNAHRNGTVTFAAGMNYTGGAEDVGGTVGSCNTSTCHNDGTVAATAVPTTNWNTPSVDCTLCHGNAPATGAHASHVNATFIAGTCGECHTAANVSTHIDGTRNTANKVTLYTTGNQTCTNSCHIANTAGDWTAGGALACTDCHGSGKVTTPALDRGFPPTSGAHVAHVGNFYVAANCVNCHNDNTTHSTLNNVVTAIGGSKVSGYTVNNCTNTCHVAADTNDWTLGTRACADCHTIGKTGLYDSGVRDQAPNSGLHATANALAHDDSFQYGASPTYTCTSCHNAVPTVTAAMHQNGGALQTPADTAYSFTSSIDSYDRTVGCAAKCHDDNQATAGDAGRWMRKWLGVTDARPSASDNPGAAVCDNCHGDGVTAGTSTVDNVWASGLSPAHGDVDGNNGIEMISQHAQCKSCHGWGDAGYNKTWGASHGNGTLSMNGPVGIGAGYDDGTVVNAASNFGCTAACHAGSLTNSGDANFNHKLADSGWTIAYGDYGSGDCNTCHSNEGRNHSGLTTESVNTHDMHTGSSLISSDCTQCHPHDGISIAPGTGIHFDGSVNFNNTKMPNSYDYSGTDFSGNCSTNTCHGSDDGTNEWKNVSLGGDACSDCHDSGKTGIFSGLTGSTPTSNKHGLHLANTALVATCSECHGHNGTLSSVSPFINHIDGTVAAGDQMTSYTNPSCANSCHNLVGNGSGAATWLTANANPLGCNDCHNKAGNTISAPIHAGLSTTAGPATGKHSAHVGGSTTYMGANSCTTCHKHQGELGAAGITAGHATGALSFDATKTDYVSGTQTCTNVCHDVVDTRDWTAGTLNCDDCHAASGKSLYRSRTSGSHAAHYGNSPSLSDYGRIGNSSTTIYNYGCGECHPASEAADHLDGSTLEVVAGVNYSGGGTGTCGTNACHQNGNSGPALATPTWGTPFTGDKCAKCHGNSPTSNAHSAHEVGIHYSDIYSGTTGLLTTATATKSHGDSATSTTISCYTCHNSVVTSSANAKNSTCMSCHTDSATPVTGNAAATIANKQLHVNGSTQVVFSMATFKSKAQLRDNITSVASVTSSWSRSGAYKAAAGYDQAKVTPGPSFVSNSCSTVDCHNGRPATWTDTNVSCNYCHTSTPQ